MTMTLWEGPAPGKGGRFTTVVLQEVTGQPHPCATTGFRSMALPSNP